MQDTGVVPTGKAVPDGGLHDTGSAGRPVSGSVQLPEAVGVVKLTTATQGFADCGSLFAEISAGQLIVHGLVVVVETTASVVELSSDLWLCGSFVLLVTLAVLVITVPAAAAPSTL